VDAVRLAVTRLGAGLAALPIAAFIGLVAVLAVLRNGIWFTPVPIVVIEENLRSFPDPFPWSESTSYGLRSLLWAFRIGTVEDSMLLTAVVTAGCIAVCVLAIALRFRGQQFRLMAMVLLLGPAVTVMLGNIGRNDMLLLTGSVLVACASPGRPWPWLTVAGAGLMIAGNPEQALVSCGILLAASLTARLTEHRRSAALAFAICGLAYLALQFRSASAGTDSRLGIFTHNLKASLELFLTSAPLVLYSGYAALWLILGFCLVNATRRDRVIICLAFIAMPILVTATTLDQTRVWVGVSTLAVLALAGSLTREATPERAQAPLLIGAAFAALMIMPAIEVTFEGIVRMPLEWVFALGVSLVSALG